MQASHHPSLSPLTNTTPVPTRPYTHTTHFTNTQDPRVERIACTHKGTYADDCLCERVRQHKCYIVATCDKDLRRRIRKVSL